MPNSLRSALAIGTLLGSVLLVGCPSNSARECGPFIEPEPCECEDGTTSVQLCRGGFFDGCDCYDPWDPYYPYDDDAYYYDDVYYDDTYVYDAGYYPCEEAYDEVCDRVDNDCDGLVDEDVCSSSPCADGELYVNWGGANVCVFAYEASRPDATATSDGDDPRYARSTRAVLPWREVTYQEASDACARTGMRLCDGDEWIATCQGPDGWAYPYGPSTFVESACGGEDERFTTTGTDMSCVTVQGAYDMVGNLAEWTRSRRAHGGSYGNGGMADVMSCDPEFLPGYDSSTRYTTVGFRCCADPFE